MLPRISRNLWKSFLSRSHHRQPPSSPENLMDTRLNSDHLPIAISLPTNQPPQQPPRRTFTNFIKANWEPFTIRTAEMFPQSFCRQFTIVPHFRRNKSSRKIFRSIHKLYLLDRSFPPFTADQTREAIKKSGTSTTAGPDNLTILHIHHLGLSDISYLTNTFNLSLPHATIPSIWKTAITITIPKPGKPPSLSSSDRPISLLCPAVKVLERLLLLQLTAAIPLSDSQHGFCPFHSTSALLPLSLTIAVTGAGHGIGRELALQLSRLGAKVVCCDINEAWNNSTVEAIRAEAGVAWGYNCDVSSRSSVHDVALMVRKEVGILDILINNAGIAYCKPFLKHSPADVDRLFAVNVMSHFH
ncbi:Short-chain dehydrogenase/reductase SDR, partial [Trinorchestia longiramus]